MNNTFTVYHQKQKIIFSFGEAPKDLKKQSGQLKWEEIRFFTFRQNHTPDSKPRAGQAIQVILHIF